MSFTAFANPQNFHLRRPEVLKEVNHTSMAIGVSATWISIFSIFLVATVIFSPAGVESRAPRCTTQSAEEAAQLQDSCKYGVYEDNCSKIHCAKGPGDICGTGMFHHQGVCGAGTFCNCGRCIGCSSFDTRECYDKTCT